MQMIGYITRADIPSLSDPIKKYEIAVMPHQIDAYGYHHYNVAIIIDIEEYDFPNKRLIKPKHESK